MNISHNIEDNDMKTHTSIYTKKSFSPAEIILICKWHKVGWAFFFTLSIGVVLMVLTGTIFGAMIPVIIFWVKASQYMYKELYD